MSFTVTFSISPDVLEFDDSATFKVIDGGALEVTDGNDVRVWSPTAWVRVERIKSQRTPKVVDGVKSF
jgi:hypothetical protein